MRDTNAIDRPALAARPPGMLHALAYRGYALIAGATLVSSIGVWMRDTTSAWTVASSGNAAAVALVQAATTLPTFLLALPAGVLADHYDRRRLLIACQAVLALVGLALAGLSATGHLGLGAITLAALAAGAAAALGAPAFQSIVPSLVPTSELRSAVALSSISFNIARVIGPAIGGVLLATAGPAAAYLINALAYGVTIAALLAIRMAPPVAAPAGIRAAFAGELRDGIGFAAHSRPFRHVLGRGMGLYTCAACYLTLTPLVAHRFGADPTIYSTLLAAIGIGSLGGGALLGFAHRVGWSDDRLLSAASIGSAAALAVMAMASSIPLASGALAMAGAMTLIQLATLNAAAQLVLPVEVRGRGLAIYLAVTVGCMAVGNLLWGALAGAFGIAASFASGAVAFAIVAVVGRWLPIAACAAQAARHATENAPTSTKDSRT